MNWCCGTFQGLTELHGQRGFSVIVEQQGGLRFWLQHRALSVDNEAALVDKLIAGPITLASELAISFCPSCGVNLSQWYGSGVNIAEHPELRVWKSQ